MKIIVGVFMLLTTVVVSAENYPGFDPQQMQDMMLKVQKMQVCMQNIDKNAVQIFEKKGRQMESEVKQLCNAGRRSEALNRALLFSQEVAASQMMNKMKNCGEMMKEMIPTFSALIKGRERENSASHICDVFN